MVLFIKVTGRIFYRLYRHSMKISLINRQAVFKEATILTWKLRMMKNNQGHEVKKGQIQNRKKSHDRVVRIHIMTRKRMLKTITSREKDLNVNTEITMSMGTKTYNRILADMVIRNKKGLKRSQTMKICVDLVYTQC